jgi:hypothetical protein
MTDTKNIIWDQAEQNKSEEFKEKGNAFFKGN